MTKQGWWTGVSASILLPGSIVRSAKRRYLSNSEADFEVFHPAGAHVAPMGMKLSIDFKELQPEMKICNRK